MTEENKTTEEEVAGANAVAAKPKFATWTTLLLAIGVLVVSVLAGVLVASTIMVARGSSFAAITPDVTLIFYLIQMVPVIVFLAIRRRRMGYGSALHFTPRIGNLSMLLWGILCLLASSVVIEPLLTLFPSESYEQVQNVLGTGGWTILSTVICAPVLEEILFRGLILESCRERLGAAWAIVISAVLFGLIHGNFVQGINAFVVGLILGYIYIRTRSLTTVVLIHALNNAIGYVTMSYFGSSSDMTMRDLITDSTVYWIVYAVSAAIFVYAMVRLVISLRNDRVVE